MRDGDRGPWRSLPPACRMAVALHRLIDLQDEHHAVRVVQDGRVLFEWWRSAADGECDPMPADPLTMPSTAGEGQ